MQERRETAYKIGVCLPPEFLEGMMDAVSERVKPLYPGYDRVFSYWPVKGTWRAAPGSSPYLGNVGEIETADEVRLEFAVREEDLEDAVRTVRENHPYEEPAIDVIPMIAWKSVIGTDASRIPPRMRRDGALRERPPL